MSLPRTLVRKVPRTVPYSLQTRKTPDSPSLRGSSLPPHRAATVPLDSSTIRTSHARILMGRSRRLRIRSLSRSGNERSLYRILTDYFKYCHLARPRLSLDRTRVLSR